MNDLENDKKTPAKSPNRLELKMAILKTPWEITSPVDFTIQAASCIHRWSNFQSLHQWMEKLYIEKGGIQLFDETSVQLTDADLDRLEKAMRERTLPDIERPEWGVPDNSYGDLDLLFIEEARAWSSDGSGILYTCRQTNNKKRRVPSREISPGYYLIWYETLCVSCTHCGNGVELSDSDPRHRVSGHGFTFHEDDAFTCDECHLPARAEYLDVFGDEMEY